MAVCGEKVCGGTEATCTGSLAVVGSTNNSLHKVLSSGTSQEGMPVPGKFVKQKSQVTCNVNFPDL